MSVPGAMLCGSLESGGKAAADPNLLIGGDVRLALFITRDPQAASRCGKARCERMGRDSKCAG
jgi:hypothetical protein